MERLKLRPILLAAATAGLLLCPPGAMAQQAKTPAERLASYEAGIATASPLAAGAFLKDDEARALAAADQVKSTALVGKATALQDLKELLSMKWTEEGANQLNQSLTIRLDVDSPLVKVGVGPAPEKLQDWIARFYPGCSAEKKAAVKKAIRHWDVIFGTSTDRATVTWDQAGTMVVAKDAWNKMVLRERNAVLEKIMKYKPDFLIYNDDRNNVAKKSKEMQDAINAVRASGQLTPAQTAELDRLARNPVTQQQRVEDQIYALGAFFDGGGITLDDGLKARINAARGSLSTETLRPEQRTLLADMLKTSVARELSGTKAGDKALAAFPGGLNIKVAPCDGAYSKYDAATGAVVLDSETIQQYMRMKGYTAESVLRSPEQLSEISKYMSPAVVYEAAHKSQADWAKAQNNGNGVYKPHVQEDEIEAMSLEGLYTTEKMGKDPAYLSIMTGARDNSAYAEKKMEIGTEYKASGSRKFGDTVRQRYCSGLPSLDSAAGQVLDAISAELERRASLPAEEKALTESTGLNLKAAMAMSPEELAGSASEVSTAALTKIQSDLSALGLYQKRYDSVDNSNRDSLRILNSGAAAKSTVPPII